MSRESDYREYHKKFLGEVSKLTDLSTMNDVITDLYYKAFRPSDNDRYCRHGICDACKKGIVFIDACHGGPFVSIDCQTCKVIADNEHPVT